MGKKKRRREVATLSELLQSTQGEVDGDLMALVILLLKEIAREAREDREHQAGDERHELVARALSDTARIERKALTLIDALESSAVLDLRYKLDDMSEMGEVESLRLQMAMDRMSKMMSTLSNLLKMMSETTEQIISHIK